MAKKQEEEVLLNDTEEVGAEPRVYELGFHLDPELPSEEVKKAYKELQGFVLSKGTIVAEVEPHKMQLAYTISRQETSGRRDFDSAFFAWIVYETTAPEHAEIISTMSADKRVIRFIDLVTTKDAARHALDVHELAQKTPEHVAEDTEEALGTEIDAALENVTI